MARGIRTTSGRGRLFDSVLDAIGDTPVIRVRLTQYVGPIARVLVRRTAAKARTVDALWEGLASHIDSPAKRAAFLKMR